MDKVSTNNGPDMNYYARAFSDRANQCIACFSTVQGTSESPVRPECLLPDLSGQTGQQLMLNLMPMVYEICNIAIVVTPKFPGRCDSTIARRCNLLLNCRAVP